MPLPIPVIGKLLWRYRKWIAIALAVLGLIAGFLLYRHNLIERGREEGRAQAQQQWDAAKLADAEAYAVKVSQYLQQVKDAEDESARNRDELARLRSKPTPRLRCAVEVPATPAVRPSDSPDSGPAGGGELQEGSGSGPVTFDPSPAVMAMADRADDLVESCREALGKWPK